MRIVDVALARVAMDAVVSGISMSDEAFTAYGEMVWFWRRDPGATLLVRPGSHGGKKGRSPGRSPISRKAIARGRPGCLGCTCQTLCISTTHAHTVLRAQSAPGLPCASPEGEEQRIGKTRANVSRENESACHELQGGLAKA